MDGSGIESTATHKIRLWKTVSIFVGNFGLGLSSAAMGPSVPSMEIILGTTTAKIAMAFTGKSLGLLLGSLVCGFLYDILNKNLLLTISVAGVGVLTAVTTYSGYLGVFLAVETLKGFFSAMIDSVANPYILQIWSGNKAKNSLLQATHCTWSIGSTISPFIVKPFLYDLKEDNIQYKNDTDPFNQTSQSPLSDDLIDKVKRVRIPFLILAAVVCATSLNCFILYLTLNPTCRESTRQRIKKTKTDITDMPSDRPFKIKLLLFMFAFFFLFLFCEGIPGSLIATFAVTGLGWSNQHGALISSLFWGGNCSMRIAGVFIARFMSSTKILVTFLSVMTVGFILLMFSEQHSSIVWIATGTVGLGTGTIFAAAIVWFSQYIEITGLVASVFLCASSAGGMTGPALTGYLFDNYGHMTFTYVLLASDISMNVICILVFIFTRGVKTRSDHKQSSRTASNEDLSSGCTPDEYDAEQRLKDKVTEDTF